MVASKHICIFLVLTHSSNQIKGAVLFLWKSVVSSLYHYVECPFLEVSFYFTNTVDGMSDFNSMACPQG